VVTVTTIAAAVGTIRTTTEAAAATIRFWTSFVDGQRSAARITAVQSGDGSFTFSGIRHFNEPKASGAARVTIRHNAGTFHGSEILEHGAKSLFRRPETEVTYEYVCHSFLLI
jgi:hypothetical protein